MRFLPFQLIAALLFATSCFAQQVIDTGVLQVKISDSVDFKTSRVDHELRLKGKTFRLKFKGQVPQGLVSGQRVKIKGRKLNAHEILITNPTGDSFQIQPQMAAASVGGIRQALVIRIQSNTAVTSATPQQIAAAFSGVDSWYLESSGNLLSVRNDLNSDGVADVTTVTVNTSSAGSTDTWGICSQARSASKAQTGYDPALYNHRICVLPPDMTYDWFGTAYINGTDIVISGKWAGGYPGGYTHEVGHNLGIHHSNTPGVEYGESACVMGGNAGTAKRDFNGPHKSQMGWAPVRDVGPGTFEINAVEQQPSARIAPDTVLRVKDTITNQYIYISFRAPLGTFGPGLDSANRLSIHSWPGGATQTVLLQTLGDGQTFSQNGVTITLAARTTVSATVQIGAACTTAQPTLSISPASQFSTDGGIKSYTLTVTNKDVNCSDPISFSFATTPPAGINATFSAPTLSVSSGQSGTVTLNVSAASGTTAGTFSVPVTVTSARGALTATAVYAMDSTAPSVPTGLKYTTSKKSITLSWLASTDADSGVASYDVYKNGVRVGSTATLSFAQNLASGTFQYQVLAIDKSGNSSALSAPLTVTISAPGGGKPGR